jgi:small-conductance mechanosensitive channel
MVTFLDLWNTEFLWNTAGKWVLALVLFGVTFTLLPLIKGYTGKQRRRWQESEREIPVAIEVITLLVSRTSKLFLFTLAIWLAFTQLSFPGPVERIERIAIVLTFWFQIGLWGMAAVRFAIDKRARKGSGMDPGLASSIDIIVFIAGLAIWAMAFLLALDNLGVQIKPLLAGLGIGGIAVALAVQTVLGDLLASMSIALDKPFAVGDALQVDDLNGTVEHIGVKSTRLRSLSGEQIIISNSDLLSSRVRNYGRMNERRVVFGTSVTYETPIEQLERIPALIREIVESQPDTRFDRSHFAKHAAASIDYETVYYVLSADYNKYMDIQQTINLQLHRELQQRGVEFAYPTQKLYVVPQGAERSAPDERGRSESQQQRPAA